MGDAGRFTEIFEATYGSVRRYVHHRDLIGSRADDVVAETFLVAWRRLDDVPADDPLPWLLAVARNACRNQRRGDRRYLALVHRLPVPEPVPPPSEPAEDGQAEAIRRALAALSPGDQEIVRLVVWDDLTATQASRVVGCSPGALRVRLHRIRQRLAKELERRNASTAPDRTGSRPRTETR